MNHTKFTGPVLLSHSSNLGTGSSGMRMNAAGALDCEFDESAGARQALAGCLDAPDRMPAGSTLVHWAMNAPFDPVRIVCTTKPSEVSR